MKVLPLALAACLTACLTTSGAAAALPLSAQRPALRAAGPDFAAYPDVVKCPTDVGLDVPENRLPPGWVATGHALTLHELQLGEFLGKQELQCIYNIKVAPQVRGSILRYAVPLESCVLGPDEAWFQCKPGVAK